MLIFDPDRAAAKKLQKQIAGLGIQRTTIVNKAGDLASYLHKHHFDLIILDIFSEEKNVELELIRETQIPFIIYTSISDDQTIEKAIKLGTSSYLLKPTSTAQWSVTIQHIIKSGLIQSNYTWLSNAGKKIRIIKQQVLCTIAHGHLSHILLADGTRYTIKNQLNKISRSLNIPSLKQINRSCFVNLDLITEYDQNAIILPIQISTPHHPITNKIKFGRTYRNDIFEYFEQEVNKIQHPT